MRLVLGADCSNMPPGPTHRLTCCQLVLLTQCLACNGLQAYAQMRQDTPDLVDLVAAGVTAERHNVAAESQGGKSAKRQRIYEDHRSTAAITAGIKRGIYHQACLEPRLTKAWLNSHWLIVSNALMHWTLPA